MSASSTSIPARPAPTSRPPVWPLRLDGIAYGGDYNPEQWPEEVWVEDVALMREAGVNLVSVGIFSWALLEPTEREYDFGWLDRVLALLHDAGIAVDLATPTAAPPAWLVRQYPRVRPVTREGHVLGPGARNGFCPSSPEYGQAAARITEQLARRYGAHPAVVLWHVHNEYGGHLPACYCETSAAAFRDWLGVHYGSLGAVNEAWGTAFWGQRYGDWDEIEPPRLAPTAVNPAQQLDYHRFCSDAYLECFRRERDILRRLAPGVPVTTNLMAITCKEIDGWRWASEMDAVSTTHYLKAELADNHIDLAMAADMSRSLAGGEPWLLMEHSTSAVNWQPRNLAKRPGELRRNSLAHLARGADGLMFFQWRAARSGAEKFHSAMLPHGGTGSRVWREVVQLGTDLAVLAELRGTRVAADAAVLWDWQSWWALELEWRPSTDLSYLDSMTGWYERLWHSHVTVDFVPPGAELSTYRLVVVPSLYLMTPAAAAALTEYAQRGGTVVVSYFSGIVDANDTIHPGAHPGALRDLLGLTVEEFLPLRQGETVTLDDGLVGDVWAEAIALHGASPIRRYLDGPAPGGPAITRNSFGAGTAWYVSTRLRGAHLDAVLRAVYADAGVAPPDAPDGVELVRRVGDGTSYLIAINHTGTAATLPAHGDELLTGATCPGELLVPAGEVRILRDLGR